MKSYRLKQILCILCIIFYSLLVANSITHEQSLLYYMLCGLGFVTMIIGLWTYLRNEKVRVSNTSQQVFNMHISNRYFTIYLAILLWLLIVHLYLMLYIQNTIIYQIPAFYCYFAFLSYFNFDMLILDQKAIYLHGKWHAYEDMSECHLERYKQHCVLYFQKDHLKEYTCDIKEKEREHFIKCLKEHIAFSIEDVRFS